MSVSDEVFVAPASSGQKRLWFLDRHMGAGATYNVCQAFRLTGTLDEDALVDSIGVVVDRHESLRTSLRVVDDELQQIVAPSVDVTVRKVDLPDADAAELADELDREAREPFDLAAAPLLRVALIRTAPGSAVFVLTVHHAVADGWSMRILFEEISRAYAARLSGSPPALPALALQYLDYALWEQELLQRPSDPGVEFWREHLSGVIGHLDLPTDRRPPTTPSSNGHCLSFRLDRALVSLVNAISRREGGSVFVATLTALAAVIYRYTGSENVLIGAPIANRRRPELESVIGFFANTVVFHANLSGDVTFRQLFARLKAEVLSVYAHQETPFDLVVRTLQPERTADHNPLFQVALAYQRQSDAGLVLPHVRVEAVPVSTGTAKFDILLDFQEYDEHIDGTLELRADLFDPAAADRLRVHLVNALTTLVQEPDARVASFAMLSEYDRQLIDEANATSGSYPRDETVVTLVEAWAAREPGRPAVVCGNVTLTYGELNARASRLAAALMSRGIVPGDRIGVALDRSVDLVVALLAIARTGAAYVPVDLSYPASRIAYIFEDAGVRLVVTAREGSSHIAGALDVFHLDEQAAAGDLNVVSSNAKPDALAYVMYTSGSTGRPKGVAIPHRAIVRLVMGQTYVDWSRVTSVLHMAPVAFDASTFELWGALLHGKRVVISPEREVNLERLGRLLDREKVDCVWLTAALFNVVVDQRPEILRGVGQLLTGGEALSLPHVRRAQAALPRTQIINGYGPTECTTFACCYRLPNPLPDEWASVPIGKPIAHTQAHVFDAAMGDVPIGVAGELYLGGDGLAVGYLNRPDLTAERFVSHPLNPDKRLYRTGDRVRWRGDGTLEFLGRFDRQIKLRGFRIELEEIEAVVGQLPHVGQAAVVVREDTPGDPRIVAYVTSTPGRHILTSDIEAAVRERVPAYMVPAAFVVLETMPMTSNGKVDRAVLPPPSFDAGVEQRVRPARTELEHQLIEIWTSTLGVVPRVTDNFFDLGGHSLKAIQLASRMREVLEIDWPFGRLLRHPTIESLAQAIEDDRRANRVGATTAIVALREHGSCPPIFFTHGVGGEVWSFAALTRHLGDDQPVYGLLPVADMESDATTLESMAARYVREIRAIVPDGPYLLVGHCSGAAVAFEMAQQLTAAGGRVGFVGVLDYTFDPVAPRSLTRRVWDIIRNLPLWLQDELMQVGWTTVTGRARSRLRAAASRMLTMLPGSSVRAPDIRDQLGMWRFPEHQAAALERAFRVFRAYQPSPLSGDVLLIKPRALPILATRPAEDLGWRRLVEGTLEIRTIKGSHETMLQEPFVVDLARILRDECRRMVGVSPASGPAGDSTG